MRTLAVAMMMTMMMIDHADARALSAAERASVQQSIASQLRDPESARFRFTSAVMSSPTTGVICGMVNARNGFGGYTGFQPFMAMLARNKQGRMVGALVSVGAPSSIKGEVAIGMCAERGLNPIMAR